MSTQRGRVLKYLEENNEAFCDDCLSEILEIYPRQTINRICRELSDKKVIYRNKHICSFCHKQKIVNSINLIRGHLNNKNNIVDINDSQYKRIEFSNRLKSDEFENRVGLYLKKIYNQAFEETPLPVGENKLHKFDLVSPDKSIVVECKSYTWTKGNNFPSAKISTALEAIFYLSRIVADKKVIAFQDSLNKKDQSLVDIFVRRYDALLDDVEIWAYYVGDSIQNDVVKVRREKGSIWYKKLYKN